jgi:site-specific DNA recombinase
MWIMTSGDRHHALRSRAIHARAIVSARYSSDHQRDASIED